MVAFTPQDDLALALSAIAQADLISLDRFRAQNLVISTKPDRSPVTDADHAVENILRQAIQAARPDDSILGEEMGSDSHIVGANQGRQWIIDPIDGTAGFLRGLPIWATLIALAFDGTPVVGVVSAPALGTRWYGAKGSGAFKKVTGRKEPTRLAVSQVSALQDATVSYNSLPGWILDGRTEQAILLAGTAWRARALGDFWSYMLVAEGVLDVAGEPDLAPYDMAALVPIIEEAGGTFSTLDGEEGIWQGTALATNSLLHEETLAITRKGS